MEPTDVSTGQWPLLVFSTNISRQSLWFNIHCSPPSSHFLNIQTLLCCFTQKHDDRSVTHPLCLKKCKAMYARSTCRVFVARAISKLGSKSMSNQQSFHFSRSSSKIGLYPWSSYLSPQSWSQMDARSEDQKSTKKMNLNPSGFLLYSPRDLRENWWVNINHTLRMLEIVRALCFHSL